MLISSSILNIRLTLCTDVVVLYAVVPIRTAHSLFTPQIAATLTRSIVLNVFIR